MRWTSFSTGPTSSTVGQGKTPTMRASTAPAAVADSSGDSSLTAVIDPSEDARVAQLPRNEDGSLAACYYGLADGKNCRVCGYCRATYKPGCDHKRNVWCNCVKFAELPEDDPDVIHEHVIEESY